MEFTNIPIILDNAPPEASCNENDITPENEILLDMSNCIPDERDHNGSLEDYLIWPKTPERKGKRQTERLPFVITSSTWKKIHEDKEKKVAANK
ncbi:hypothetical protein QE152_g21787 [Popillia japonica]|uniref:Uncharacterized protein n=1 Tax=Popillia japonica TaxID=7064 RepID=A0AAW1KN99_POPJA